MNNIPMITIRLIKINKSKMERLLSFIKINKSEMEKIFSNKILDEFIKSPKLKGELVFI